MRFVNGLIVSCLAAGAVCAQPAAVSAQETERARQLLNSAQWVDKAWGAYLAGRLHSDDLDRLLIEQFREAGALRNAQGYTDEHAYVATLFDAAIEAGITVPAGLLEPFEESWPYPVLILLARDTTSEDSLLRLREEKSRNILWLAANNLLLERKSQAWYAAILGEIGITHRFTVIDTDRGGGIGGGQFGGGFGDGVAAMPKGFPPVALYTLQDFAQRGSVLLARGPRDVYYKRTIVPTDKQVGFGSSASSIDRMAIRIGYLAQLRSVPFEQAERLFHSETQIRYTGAENFEREVERSMQIQEQGIRAFLQAIEKNGLRATGVRLRIVPEVNDKRENMTDPLPVVAPRDIDLN
ncbi:MAG: hypothetical protein ABSE42_18985 [Bryobacteraceae bacterium]|jgi:hypothetical protein